MSPVLVLGLTLAIVIIVLYVICSVYRKKKPDLLIAVQLAVATTAIASGIRLMGFVFTDEFRKAVAMSNHESLWAIAGEDGLFILLGGLAIIWVSVQSVWDGFSDK